MSGADAHDLNDLNSLHNLTGSDALADVAVASWSTASQSFGAQRGPQAHGALARLRALGEMTRALGAALGLTLGELAASEAFDRVERFITLTVEQVEALPQDDARRWFETLGDDLELALGLEGLDTAFEPVSVELRAGDDPAGALAAFQRDAQAIAATQGDSVSVNARLRIGKRQAQRLAEQALRERRVAQSAEVAEVTTAPEAALVFYSAAACERMLTLRAAPEWGRRGLGGDETRLCVVVCDSAGYLAGLALEVIGAAGEVTPEWLPVSRAAWRRFVERVEEMRRLDAAESAWSGLTLALTPEHLRIASRAPGSLGPGLERVAARLQGLRSQVAACALASHVERVASPDDQGGDLTLRFAGARPAVARLSSGSAPDGLEPQPRDALIELARWAYRDASPDKLAIARQALADTLAAGASLTLAQLCVAAEPALDTARANFAIYLRGATERYFQLRATAQQTVSGFADATRTAVASLTTDITDNLFRTVGLIVGVVIAWLIQPSASLALVRIAAALYTVYVLFIVVYLLRARQARYHLERKGLDDTLAAMPELTRAERDRLRRPAVDAEAHFERYYRLTRAIYVGLAIGGALVFALMFTPVAHLLLAHAPR